MGYTSRPIPIACTLPSDAVEDRVGEWRSVLGHVTARSAVEGGVRLALGADVDLGELARLVQAEQHCCAFFSFAITVDDRGAALEVRAPADAMAVVEQLFGAPA